MIISASRRTDIPAFYGQWFANRLEAGYCRVPNPFRPSQVATVSLRREDVDAFVFWTRDPRPFMATVDELERLGFPSMFLVTLTGYGPPLEPYAPRADEAVAGLRALSDHIGPDRVVWRYDPIVLGPGLGPDDHRRRFADLCRRLEGATQVVKISFVDLYRKTTRRLASIDGAYCVDPAARPEARGLVAEMAAAAGAAGMIVESCAEEVDLGPQGVAAGACIDAGRLSRLVGRPLAHGTDPGQRRHCHCAPSRDIGINDTCRHGCVYCYATSSHEAALRRSAEHDGSADSLLPLVGD